MPVHPLERRCVEHERRTARTTCESRLESGLFVFLVGLQHEGRDPCHGFTLVRTQTAPPQGREVHSSRHLVHLLSHQGCQEKLKG